MSKPQRQYFSRLKHRKGARPKVVDHPPGWIPIATSADARGVVLWYLANAIEHLSYTEITDARISDAFQATRRAVDYLAAKSVAPKAVRAWRALPEIEERLGLKLGGKKGAR